jgi:hypothetical protein
MTFVVIGEFGCLAVFWMLHQELLREPFTRRFQPTHVPSLGCRRRQTVLFLSNPRGVL